jgi:hypothetical protein
VTARGARQRPSHALVRHVLRLAPTSATMQLEPPATRATSRVPTSAGQGLVRQLASEALIAAAVAARALMEHDGGGPCPFCDGGARGC